MKNLFLLSFLFIITLLTQGCSGIPVSEFGSDDYKKVTSFSPSEEKAVLYVYRDINSPWGITILDLDIGDKTVGTYPSCYMRIETNPGVYHLEADNPDTFGFEQEMDISIKSGEVKILEFKPINRLLIPGESKLIPRSIDATKDLVNKQKLCAVKTIVI